MASGHEPIRIGSQPPFAVPAERRDPARRLRGRLVAPVTVWTAGDPSRGAGLTVSSILVACPMLLAFGVNKQDLLPRAREDLEAELARRP